MTISDATLSVDVFTTIRAIIVAAAPYVTNSTTSATTAASIRAAYNDRETSKPQIVIYPVEKDESNFKFGSNEGKKLLNVVVDCYYTNTLGVDQLYDQVETAIKAASIDGMDIIAITSNYGFSVSNDSKFQLKSATFTFDRE